MSILNITDDNLLTKLRQEHYAKYGSQTGFPVHFILIQGGEFEVKAFFTKAGLDKFLDELDPDVRYIYKMAHVDDIRNVSYKV